MRDEATDPMDTLNATVRAFWERELVVLNVTTTALTNGLKKSFTKQQPICGERDVVLPLGNSDEDIQRLHLDALKKTLVTRVAPNTQNIFINYFALQLQESLSTITTT